MKQYTVYITDHTTGESCTLQAADLVDFYYATLRGLEGLNRHHGAILEAMNEVVKKEYKPKRRPEKSPAGQKETKGGYKDQKANKGGYKAPSRTSHGISREDLG